MRLSSVCVAAVGAAFVAGLLPGVLAQLGLGQPATFQPAIGEPGSVFLGARHYTPAIAMHIQAFAGPLPLAGIALILALIAEARAWSGMRIAAIIALAAAPLQALALFGSSAAGSGDLPTAAIPHIMLLIQAVAGLAGLVILAVLLPRPRGPAIVFAGLAGLAMVPAGLMELASFNVGLEGGYGSYMIVSLCHILGVAVMLNTLGALAAWSIRREGQRRIWFSLAVGLGVLATGGLAAREELVLFATGALAEDREAFAASFGYHTLLLLALAAVLVAAAAWLAVAVRSAKPPPGVESAFD